MMHAMGLGCNQDIFQWPEVRANVRVDEQWVPFLDNENDPDLWDLEGKEYERQDRHEVERQVVDEVGPVVGEEIDLTLRVVDLVKFPQHGNLVHEEMLRPVQQV